jgi:hypothetical protein
MEDGVEHSAKMRTRPVPEAALFRECTAGRVRTAGPELVARGHVAIGAKDEL